jgi:hypothetical protein
MIPTSGDFRQPARGDALPNHAAHFLDRPRTIGWTITLAGLFTSS